MCIYIYCIYIYMYTMLHNAAYSVQGWVSIRNALTKTSKPLAEHQETMDPSNMVRTQALMFKK